MNRKVIDEISEIVGLASDQLGCRIDDKPIIMAALAIGFSRSQVESIVTDRYRLGVLIRRRMGNRIVHQRDSEAMLCGACMEKILVRDHVRQFWQRDFYDCQEIDQRISRFVLKWL